MLLGTNQDQGQQFNRRVVLETVRAHGPLSRADITRRAGLSYQTVSNLAALLLDEGLLLEERRHDGRRGQPPVDLAINPGGAFSIGVSFDHRRLVAVLVDLAGKVRKATELPVPQAAPDTVLPLLRRAVADLMRTGRIARRLFYGVGLVMPGLSQRGALVGLEPTLAHPWLQHWHDPTLFSRLSWDINLPLWTDNDASAAAIGERLHGIGRRYENFLLVYIAAGIGAGIVIGGQPYRGRRGKAGEFGHLVVDVGGRPCPCGNRGCLERYASLSAAQSAVTGRPEGSEAVDPEMLENALAAGDPRLLGWLDQAAQCLSAAIVSVENILDPETVLVGGTAPVALLDALMARIEPLPRSLGSERDSGTPRLMRVEVGLRNAALGAAALPMFDSTSADRGLLLKKSGVDIS
jgi:predicted NBD/HSP70 family sugar kinase